MLGSGMPETYEVAVILRYIKETVAKYKRPLEIPSELYDLVLAIENSLDEMLTTTLPNDSELRSKVPKPYFKYWDSVSIARETYRDDTKTTFSGETVLLKARDLVSMVERWLEEIDKGIDRAMQFGTQGHGDSGKTGITPTYFAYNVTRWVETGEVNRQLRPLVVPLEMHVSLLPLFLEGPMRMMKTVSPEDARQIYQKVRASPLRDEGLKMYTISASLKGQSFDMGREMAFAAGWLENQSVWLHMSYKFYLEIIRHNLFAEFFEEMVSGGILPFMNAKVYGRSLLECSSFIASSAFEDPAIRGRGFLARLSGSTAEFLSMWMLMMLGPKPFFIDDSTGQVRMQLIPALPRWLFKPDPVNASTKTLSFKLFGAIDVTYYHNRGDDDLFRILPTRYVIGLRDGSTFYISGPSIPPDLSDKIRRVVFVASIDVYFDK